MDTDKHVRRVLKALSDAIADHDLHRREVELRVGWEQGYLSQVLNRRVKLRLEHVLLVLGAIGVDPGAFFRSIFGSGPAGEVAEAAPLATDLEELRHEVTDLLRLTARNSATLEVHAEALRALERALAALAPGGSR